MNDMILPQGAYKTMSSREVAQLCEKRHDNVCRDIEKLNETYTVMGFLKIEEGYYSHPSTGNQQHREFLLTKEQCIDLITGYRADLRIKINRRWAELETQISQPSYMIEDPIKRAEKWIEEARQQILLQEKLELQAPKVAYFDQVADRCNLMNATQVSQKFGMSAVVMNRHLDKLGVYNQTVKRSRVFSTWFEQKGYGELKQTESGYPQAMFTTAGEQWIFQKFVSEGIING